MARRDALTRLAILAGCLVVWEGVAASGLVSHFLIVPLGAISRVLWSGLSSGKILHHLRITAEAVLVAYALAASVGLAVGLTCGNLRRIREPVHFLLVSLNSTPVVLLFPLFLFWFGFGRGSKVAFGALYGFLPIALNAVAAVRSVDPVLGVVARSMGTSSLQTYCKVTLPACLPTMVTGLRTGMNFTLIGVIFGEMTAPMAGLGYLLEWASESLETAEVYAYVTVTVLIATVLNEGLRRVDVAMSRWR